MLIQSNDWGEDIKIDRSLVKTNLQEIQTNIAHYNVKIIAVTKYFGLDAILAGYEAGIRDFGESRALDAIEKIKKLPEELRKNSTFHFIGHLQSNKAEKVVQHFDVIHSVDSLKIAKTISEAACRLNKREKVLLQINMAPLEAEEDELKRLFKDVREFRDELEKEFNVTLPELSMGMSNDYKIALTEGATIIRIGRKLFK